MRVKGDPDCTLCPLHEYSKNVCIMGRGSIPAKVLLIGEAPGAHEANTGQPFMGRAGQELENLIRGVARLRERDVYITNAVKCRPPDNRTPKRGEVNACSKWLSKEIKEVKPRFVILLGATAVKAVLGHKAKLSELRGRPIEKDGVIYLPTNHPAAHFYDVKKKEIIETDFGAFGKIIRKGKVPGRGDINFTVVRTIEEVQEMVREIASLKEVAFDIETQGLDPFDEDKKIVMVGIGTDKKQWIIPLHHRESPFLREPYQRAIMKTLASILEGKRVIAHNGKFDSLWVKIKFGVDIKVTFDTMIGDFLVNENHPHNLEYLAGLYFGTPNWDIGLENKTGSSPLDKLAEYCAKDLYWTFRLKRRIRRLMRAEGVYDFFRWVMMPASQMMVDVETRGVYVHRDKMQEVDDQLTAEINEIQDQIDKYRPGLNCNSPKQVGEFLFGDLGIDPLKKTRTEMPSTSESILKQIRDKHPVVDLILQWKRKYKLRTFVRSWAEKMDKNDRIHPRFKLTGTVTGRLSCGDPNLQQVPRNSMIRSLITAPKGWTFVEADESQIELRIAAMFSGDRVMKRAFQLGEDIHTRTGVAITGKEKLTSEERKRAKAVNFGFLYGMGAKKFRLYARDSYDLHFTEAESYRIRRDFFDLYRGLIPWHERQRRIVRRYGQVRHPTGRVRHLPNIYSADEGKQAEAERQAINSPVQGFASDINLMAAIQLWRKFHKKGILHVVGLVHDSILMEVKTEHLDEVLPEIKKAMAKPRLLKKLGVEMTVPLEGDISIGAWGKGIEWDEEE